MAAQHKSDKQYQERLEELYAKIKEFEQKAKDLRSVINSLMTLSTPVRPPFTIFGRALTRPLKPCEKQSERLLTTLNSLTASVTTVLRSTYLPCYE